MTSVPHLLDPNFDSTSDLTLLSVRQKTVSLTSVTSDSRPLETLEAGQFASSVTTSSNTLVPGLPKHERRNVHSLPKIFRMSSLLDDVPEEVEETASIKTCRAEDSSADSSGIYGDPFVSNERVNVNAGLSEDPASRRDRLAQFWASLDAEQETSTSLNRMRSINGLGTNGKSRKLRKARSAVSVHPLRRFSTLSTTSLHVKLRKKMRPSILVPAALDPHQGQDHLSRDDGIQVASPGSVLPGRLAEFPNGVKQMGSGIGFTYNLPQDQTKSKASICTMSNAPLACHGMFQGLGLTGLGLRLGSGLAASSRGKARDKIRGTLRSLGSSISVSLSASGVPDPGTASGVRPGGGGGEDEFGESNWGLMAVPSGSVMVIGDVGAVDARSPVSGGGDGSRVVMGGGGVEVGGMFGGKEGELEPGVVGRIGSVEDDGEEVITLRLVPSRPAESGLDGDEATTSGLVE